MGEARIFHGRPARKTGSEATPYVIQFPPPNVTGTLHMGHAFNQTIMDGLVRYHRMSGNDTVFIPAPTTPASPRRSSLKDSSTPKGFAPRPGPREVRRKVWEWKEKSGSTITGQVRRLGASADWPREYFTMDERMSRGVVETFVRLHKQGLIYRGKRLVNWDPKLLTACPTGSGVREPTATCGILYPFVDGPQTITDKDGQSVTLRGLTIATTRPETMLADGALCIRKTRATSTWSASWSSCRCATATSPSSPTISSTPNSAPAASRSLAHDFNDYACALHDLPMIVIFTLDAHINENGPKQFQGMERYRGPQGSGRPVGSRAVPGQGRAAQDDAAKGDRTGVVLEPMLTDQWFVAMSKAGARRHAEPGRASPRWRWKSWPTAASSSTPTTGPPSTTSGSTTSGLVHLAPAVVSHQIPAWYSEDGQVFVAHNEAEAIEQARAAGVTGALARDDDARYLVLVRPGAFTTLGWPENTPDLQRYLPSSVLVTGFDIIFFWVARMVMLTTHMTGQIPFKHVCVHGLIRDAGGQKDETNQGQHAGPRGPDRRHRPGWAGGQAHLRPDEPQAGRLHRRPRAASTRTASPPSAPTRCASPWPPMPRWAATSTST